MQSRLKPDKNHIILQQSAQFFTDIKLFKPNIVQKGALFQVCFHTIPKLLASKPIDCVKFAKNCLMSNKSNECPWVFEDLCCGVCPKHLSEPAATNADCTFLKWLFSRLSRIHSNKFSRCILAQFGACTMSALRTSGPRVSKDWVVGCIMPNQLTQPSQSTDPNLAWTLQRKDQVRLQKISQVHIQFPTVSLRNGGKKNEIRRPRWKSQTISQTRAARELCATRLFNVWSSRWKRQQPSHSW